VHVSIVPISWLMHRPYTRSISISRQCRRPIQPTTIVSDLWNHYHGHAISHSCVRQLPVHLSVRPSHEWISQKRLKLGLCSFHRTELRIILNVAPCMYL